MLDTIERPRATTDKKVAEGRQFFKVFLGFRKPDGMVSVSSSCNIYERLGEIFQKPPEEIFRSVGKLVYENGDGFMQEYLSLEDASLAVAKASLFANIAMCVCFLKQEAYFYIRETKE